MVSKYFLQFFEWLKNFISTLAISYVCILYFDHIRPHYPLLPSSSSHGAPSFQQAPLLFPCLSVVVIAYMNVWGGRLPEHDLHGDSPADESRVPLKLSFEAPEKCPFWGPTALNLDRESSSSDFLSLLLLIFFLFRDKK